jgi:DeoR family fructose operon transcriptional repressor
VNEIGGKDMLTEERFTRILSILESMGSVTVQQLMTELDASESTIRRDLNTLDANGQLIKVHFSHCFP